jgi:hypothetical protein
MITDMDRFKARAVNHGITSDEFLAMLYVQNFNCKICNDPLIIEGQGQSAIDHCHSTFKVRGVLCGSCNLTVGMVEKRGLENIANYLNTGPRIGHSTAHFGPVPGRKPGRPKKEKPLTSTERARLRRKRLKEEAELLSKAKGS